MPRTFTKTVTVYQFNELTGEAKERAREWVRADGFDQGADYIRSLEALARHFDARVAGYSIDWSGSSWSSVQFAVPENVGPDEIEERIAKLGSVDPKTGKGNGDCVLTGYCADEDAIDGVRVAWTLGERSLQALLDNGFQYLLRAGRLEYEYQQSDEAVSEMCEANGWEFDAQGRPV